MSNKRISDLPAKNTPDTADLVPIIDTQNGVGNYTSKKTTVGGLLSGVSALAAAEITAQKGQVNGLATLGNDGKVTSAQLPGATTLDGLTDVIVTSPTTGQVLKFDGMNWVNDTDATGSGGGGSGLYVASTGFGIIPAAGDGHAAGQYSSVGGGQYNTASGNYCFIGNGIFNVSGSNSVNSAAVVGGGENNAATGWGSFVGGGTNNQTGGDKVAICGGTGNSCSAYASFIGGGIININGGTGAVIAGGCGNYALDNYAVIGGGFYNIAANGLLSNACSVIGGGRSNTTSAYYSSVLGGYNNKATERFSAIVGGSAAVANRHGMEAFAAGSFSAPGDAQRVNFVLRNSGVETDLKLYLDGVSKKLTIPAGKALFATVTIACIGDGAAGAAHYVRKVAIKNVGGNTSLIGTVTTLGTDIGFSGGGVSITADNVNDALQIEVSAGGDPARWVAHVDGIEIAYAV